MVENKSTTTMTLTFSVHPAVFIMFAEYLGYVSPLIEWAEKMCTGTDIPSYQRDILKRDAMSIYNKMLSEMKIEGETVKERIKALYLDYYGLFLKTYDDNVKKLDNSRTSDLPF